MSTFLALMWPNLTMVWSVNGKLCRAKLTSRRGFLGLNSVYVFGGERVELAELELAAWARIAGKSHYRVLHSLVPRLHPLSALRKLNVQRLISVGWRVSRVDKGEEC